MKNKWIDFFKPFFPTLKDAFAFVKACESINPDYKPLEELEDSTPKIMMHQTVRLISLSDDIRTIKPSKDPLSLFFIIVCAECVAKLSDHYNGEGKSRDYVRKFFNDFIRPKDRQKLEEAFSYPFARGRTFGYEKVIDLLYDIRCDVAHEGRYWGFSFPDAITRRTIVNPHPRRSKVKHPETEPVSARITFNEIRDIIVRGCIAAVQEALKKHQSVPAINCKSH